MRKIGTRTIQTPRLLLRRFREGDAGDMYRNWVNDPQVTRYLSWAPHGNIGVTEEILAGWLRAYRQPYYYNWAIEHKEDRQVIGSLTMMNINLQKQQMEIGYCIGKAYWGKGLASEALTAVLGYMFRKGGAQELTAKHHIENLASGRVMEKCGMKYAGSGQGTIEAKGMQFLYRQYRITKQEWEDYNR